MLVSLDLKFLTLFVLVSPMLWPLLMDVVLTTQDEVPTLAQIHACLSRFEVSDFVCIGESYVVAIAHGQGHSAFTDRGERPWRACLWP